MVIIELKFLTGRFHATPWGRNVNEGVPEWPPSPYRLARAIIDVWKRRFPYWPESRVLPILHLLSSPVLFHLPDATAGHTRAYLHSNLKDPEKKQLVFDPFVIMDRNTAVYMGFETEAPEEISSDLDALLNTLNFFGRSESWIKARIASVTAPLWNCVPSAYAVHSPGVTKIVACLLREEGYGDLASRAGRNWFKDICLSTEDLHGKGWSNPPALRWVEYSVPAFIVPKLKRMAHHSPFHWARYALSSKVLPRIEETVTFAERIRAKLMGIHKRIQGDPSLVSPLFSGKQEDGTPIKGHHHAFFIPLDEDGDGWLDHFLVYSPLPFSKAELETLDQLRSIWQSGGKPDVRLLLLSLSPKSPIAESQQWISATPFVTARHHRKGRGSYAEWLASEIRRECIYHGLPEPVTVTLIPHTLHTSRPVRWLQFVRSRKGDQPLQGCGSILTFDKPVSGPFALGSVCHYGLGLFIDARTASVAGMLGRFAL